MEFSLKRIAAHIRGQIQGNGNKTICGVAPFETADADQITFADGAKFIKRLQESRAGAVIVPSHVKVDDINLVQVDNPKIAFSRVIELFHPREVPYEGISSQAVIGEGLVIGNNTVVAPMAYIGNNVCVGDRTIIHPGVVIRDDVTIGNDVVLHSNVSILDRCRIGDRVTIHAGTVIGSDGYGFAPEGETYQKIPHIGIVQIDDDVEIGAVNTIDRGSFGKTWIQKGVKTDNLVHVAHNVTIGKNTLVVAQVGIAGSTSIGQHVILAGQAGIAGHLTIGDNSIIGPMTGIGKSVEPGQILSGGLTPLPHRKWLRMQRVIPELPELKKRIAALENQIKRLSGEKD
jgi:UDP-3-O-[3-hydroxymyristoyl] glucosamine N-acyltransferase